MIQPFAYLTLLLGLRLVKRWILLKPTPLPVEGSCRPMGRVGPYYRPSPEGRFSERCDRRIIIV